MKWPHRHTPPANKPRDPIHTLPVSPRRFRLDEQPALCPYPPASDLDSPNVSRHSFQFHGPLGGAPDGGRGKYRIRGTPHIAGGKPPQALGQYAGTAVQGMAHGQRTAVQG